MNQKPSEGCTVLQVTHGTRVHTDTCSALATGIRKIFCSTRVAPSSFIATSESFLSKVNFAYTQMKSSIFIARIYAGLELRNPERVPFRLTRDIVAGMGYSGRSRSPAYFPFMLKWVSLCRYIGSLSALLRGQFGSAASTHRVTAYHSASVYPRPSVPLDSVPPGYSAATGGVGLVVTRAAMIWKIICTLPLKCCHTGER